MTPVTSRTGGETIGRMAATREDEQLLVFDTSRNSDPAHASAQTKAIVALATHGGRDAHFSFCSV
jgi:hypothetical protein